MRIKATRKLTDQKVAARIAKYDKSWDVCNEAVKILTDQGLLAYVAQTGEYNNVRIKAADKLDDKSIAQTVYLEIAKNDESGDMRIRAAGNLDDKTIAQAIYADIAKNDKFDDTRMDAADKLDDKSLAQTIYTDIAKNAENKHMAKAALKKLTDQTLLADVAINGKGHDVRHKACEKIGHDWKGCKCSRCGKSSPAEYHIWEDYTCPNCDGSGYIPNPDYDSNNSGALSYGDPGYGMPLSWPCDCGDNKQVCTKCGIHK